MKGRKTKIYRDLFHVLCILLMPQQLRLGWARTNNSGWVSPVGSESPGTPTWTLGRSWNPKWSLSSHPEPLTQGAGVTSSLLATIYPNPHPTRLSSCQLGP